MADIDLLIQELRAQGHTVQYPHPVPSNAGDYEFIIDGATLNLEEARALLTRDVESDA